MKLIFFSGMTNAEVLHQVEHGYRMPCPPGCPDTLYNIMLECWNKDPMKRPTFETLQWKLEDFFTMEGSEYKEASAYWIENFEFSLYIKKCDSCAVIILIPSLWVSSLIYSWRKFSHKFDTLKRERKRILQTLQSFYSNDNVHFIGRW